ncbi:hypothetical protein AVEN_157339-1 [Araneus ventricosus]|uniref:Uncharacterized protein n=1 Tax=Araneus ventricosus TaxID=182803 RepID=A0A4Y2UTM7_ARAVE|nr:hypothetical protein AVEN_157339-1 [Araneus ventricosus]
MKTTIITDYRSAKGGWLLNVGSNEKLLPVCLEGECGRGRSGAEPIREEFAFHVHPPAGNLSSATSLEETSRRTVSGELFLFPFYPCKSFIQVIRKRSDRP